MAPSTTDRELVLAHNQYAYIQDEVKGHIKTHVGPTKYTPSGNDRPIIYDYTSKKFVTVALEQSTQQFSAAAEGSYLVLENPTGTKEPSIHPFPGIHDLADLDYGRKINIPGPVTFALWPGQTATTIEGHRLRSNEYLIARVYNVNEAQQNWPESHPKLPESLVTGKLIVIKGTELSFFIPPTGFEVVKSNEGGYIRKAVTLERLEYSILLDEDGNKRYEKGPSVVFPKATESFVSKKNEDGSPGGIKFKAIELNEQMGIYVKVIADYEEEDGTKRLVGEELFITGKDQKIYYPRPEHAIIEYGNDGDSFKRQRYYGIAIPAGEARYVLDKNTGEVENQTGPKVFLPDPRNQVIVRRVLDPKIVSLWYPGNNEAISYNDSLRTLTEGNNYVQDTSFRSAMDMNRSMNRGTKGSGALMASASVVGDTMTRGTKFTPPPMLTLNTKYEGVPTIKIWTGYAVQIVDKQGNRRIEQGPKAILLKYDESLESFELSTGNPKTTDTLKTDVYLRVSHNKVSDTVKVETKDMVEAEVKLSYRVNFEGDSSKWFSVENYVKFMCDHVRSKLRAVVKRHTIKEFLDDSARIIRDAILGAKTEGTERPGLRFEENGMRIYDVEVLKTKVSDAEIAELLENAQRTTVQHTLTASAKQNELSLVTAVNKVETEINQLNADFRLAKIKLDEELASRQSEFELAQANAKATLLKAQAETTFDVGEIKRKTAEVELTIKKAVDTQDIAVAEAYTDQYVKRLEAVSDELVTALTTFAFNETANKLSSAVAPLAIIEQTSVGTVIERLIKGTNLENGLNKLMPRK
jgi:major vault protein